MCRQTLDNHIDSWVTRNFGDASFVAKGGQRWVYRVGSPPSALKIWRVADQVQHERHVREISAMGALAHEGLPRIVAHLSQVELGGELLAMYQEQWFDAPSIQQIREACPIEDPALSALAKTGLETIGHLHSAGIVHRDISLGNVLWDGNRCYVIDLGLAKHLDLDSLTSTGQNVGMTLVTASPEQLRGIGSELRASTDIYSFGVVLFLAATGLHPFIGNGETLTVQQLLARQTDKDFQTPPPPNLPIDRMLEPVALFRPDARSLLGQMP